MRYNSQTTGCSRVSRGKSVAINYLPNGRLLMHYDIALTEDQARADLRDVTAHLRAAGSIVNDLCRDAAYTLPNRVSDLHDLKNTIEKIVADIRILSAPVT